MWLKYRLLLCHCFKMWRNPKLDGPDRSVLQAVRWCFNLMACFIHCKEASIQQCLNSRNSINPVKVLKTKIRHCTTKWLSHFSRLFSTDMKLCRLFLWDAWICPQEEVMTFWRNAVDSDSFVTCSCSVWNHLSCQAVSVVGVTIKSIYCDRKKKKICE